MTASQIKIHKVTEEELLDEVLRENNKLKEEINKLKTQLKASCEIGRMGELVDFRDDD